MAISEENRKGGNWRSGFAFYVWSSGGDGYKLAEQDGKVTPLILEG